MKSRLKTVVLLFLKSRLGVPVFFREVTLGGSGVGSIENTPRRDVSKENTRTPRRDFKRQNTRAKGVN